MNKRKSIICTILYVFAIIVILTASMFVKSEVNGINLYQLIMCMLGAAWLADSIRKFYEWLQR